MLDLLEDLGATRRVARRARGRDLRRRHHRRGRASTRALAERIRASFLLAGPLLARFGRADMPPPGGDVIGRRRLDPHLDAFRALGARVERHERDTSSVAAPGGLRAGEVFMDEPSVMAHRERAAGRRADAGRDQSSATPPASRTSQDLARMLVKMGADIRGIGSNVLHVTGADVLGGTTHDIGPDHIEIGSFMAHGRA